ncbi:MAG TPA: hypothetical protein VF719_10335 [Abditibacteriaceae bacterium]|jgi:hypothetical protein
MHRNSLSFVFIFIALAAILCSDHQSAFSQEVPVAQGAENAEQQQAPKTIYPQNAAPEARREATPYQFDGTRIQGYSNNRAEAKSGQNRPDNPRQNQMRGRQQKLEVSLRNLMTRSGVADAGIQNAIIQHMASEVRARFPLRDHGQKLYMALQSPETNENRLRQLLDEFQGALDADKLRRMNAESALDAKIGFSRNARLKSTLLLLGVIGDGALITSIPSPNNDRPAAPNTGREFGANQPFGLTQDGEYWGERKDQRQGFPATQPGNSRPRDNRPDGANTQQYPPVEQSPEPPAGQPRE